MNIFSSEKFSYHILCSTYVCIQFFPQKIAQKAPKQGESRWGNKSLSFPRFRRFYTKIRWISRLFRSFYSAKRLCGVCRRSGRPLPLRPALRHASNRKNKRGDHYLNICLKRRFSPVRALRISHKYTIFRLSFYIIYRRAPVTKKHGMYTAAYAAPRGDRARRAQSSDLAPTLPGNSACRA